MITTIDNACRANEKTFALKKALTNIVLACSGIKKGRIKKLFGGSYLTSTFDSTAHIVTFRYSFKNPDDTTQKVEGNMLLNGNYVHVSVNDRFSVSFDGEKNMTVNMEADRGTYRLQTSNLISLSEEQLTTYSLNFNECVDDLNILMKALLKFGADLSKIEMPDRWGISRRFTLSSEQPDDGNTVSPISLKVHVGTPVSNIGAGEEIVEAGTITH